MVDDTENKHRTPCKYLSIVSTVLYVLMLPFLFGLALCSFMVFDKPDLSVTFGSAIIFAFFCIPLSIIPAVYFIWSNYSKKRYRKVYFYCLLPLFTFSIAMLVIMGLAEVNDFFL